MKKDDATLSFDAKTLALPVYQPTLGADVIDVRNLGSETGAYTYDPGYLSTASCESKITFINGGKGVLLYRGYPIEQLAEQMDFLAVCYLLIHGELPDEKEKAAFVSRIQQHTFVDSNIECIFKGFSEDAHPMSMLISTVGALAGQYHAEINIKSSDDRLQLIEMMIAKIPLLVAMCYRHSQGQCFIKPDPSLDYTANFVRCLFGDKDPIDPLFANALDKIFILHADHEQNASTSTVRLAGSTGTDGLAAVVAGIAALWGPAHGGANEATLNMLRTIGDVANIEEYVAKAKNKEDPFRLMGFGHRVYKNHDPRATIMRETCHGILEATDRHNDPTFKVALALEKIAREDPYFIDRKLYPNVDFYSGITLDALNIPSNLFTNIFALARTVGWMAHWHEMLSDPTHKIGRPRQLYSGSAKRDVQR